MCQRTSNICAIPSLFGTLCMPDMGNTERSMPKILISPRAKKNDGIDMPINATKVAI